MDNNDPLSDELKPNTAMIFDFGCVATVLTDSDLSMLGEARHKTIGGRGVVGRLVDQTQAKRGTQWLER